MGLNRATAYSARSRFRTAWILIALCSIQSANAQELAGTAFVAGSRLPLSGAAILLVDGSGVIVTGALSAADGRYFLRAPRPGLFKVRARRIGFSPDSSAPLTFNVGQRLQFDAVLTPVRTFLEVVKVQSLKRCDAAPDSADITYELWQATQNALAANIAAGHDSNVVYAIERFQKLTDSQSSLVLEGWSWDGITLSTEPYQSASPDTLMQLGFVRTEGDSSVFYAPDARTLTADSFVKTHCMRTIADPTRARLIGLAFEPVTPPERVDIKGALWLDRASHELEGLEYHYVPPRRRTRFLPVGIDSAHGYVQYRKLANGAWVVADWSIRVPVHLTPSRPPRGRSMRNTPPRTARGLWETGGHLKAVLREEALSSVDVLQAAVEGRIAAEARDTPLHDIEVVLATADSTARHREKLTDKDGAFRFENVQPGSYTIHVSHAMLDTLNLIPPSVPIKLTPGFTRMVTIKLSSPAEGRAALCGDSLPGSVILHGRVTDSTTGNPVPQARVVVNFLAAGDPAAPEQSAGGQLETRSDADGKYVFCGMRATSGFLIGVSDGQRKTSLSIRRTLFAGKIYLVDLNLSGR
jgi:hypothetical protein